MVITLTDSNPYDKTQKLSFSTKGNMIVSDVESCTLCVPYHQEMCDFCSMGVKVNSLLHLVRHLICVDAKHKFKYKQWINLSALYHHSAFICCNSVIKSQLILKYYN